jgi:hypothetical protein
MFMTDEQAAELTEPGVCTLDDPTPLVAAQLATVFIAPVPAVLSVGDVSSMPRFFSRSRNGSES